MVKKKEKDPTEGRVPKINFLEIIVAFIKKRPYLVIGGSVLIIAIIIFIINCRK